jgi:hypothetical protein
MKRRDFLKLGGLGAAMSLGTRELPALSAARVVREPARDVLIQGTADVVVCGAGPAGVAAAVAAARKGAKARLIELHGCLGGIWTAGLLSWILDYKNKSGLMAEIWQRIEKRGSRAFTKGGIATNGYDPEMMKLVLEEMCVEAKVEVHLHTRVCAAVKNDEKRLTHVITESKSGREAFAGNVFVDCTGDGDLAAQAGCSFDLGHSETGDTQPFSLMALITGITPEGIAGFFRDDDGKDWAGPKDRLKAEMEKGGHSPSYAKPTIFRLRDDLFAMMANHEYGVKGTNARDLTTATLRARKELHALVDGLRSLGGAWKNVRIVATAEQIGVREGRRIHGLCTVSTDDLREGRSQKDAICRTTFGIDVHSTDPKKEKGIAKTGFRAKPYDIPLRALIAKDVKGLMMAGRCISGDFIAHSSYRVTGNSVAMGEAAGKTAAVAAKSGRLPSAVDISEIAG